MTSTTAVILPGETDTPQPIATPQLGIGSTQISPIDGMEMMYVPMGTFTMGSGATNYNGVVDDPPHTVDLDAFWIDKTEVTNQMYQLCVSAGNCELPGSTRSYTRSSYFGDPNYANYPVVFVDWNDAKAYCEWAKRELPTEAQWEKAARGTDLRLYPWGDEEVAGNLANFADINTNFDQSDHSINDGYGDTAPVGNYPDGASQYRVLDMAGNVWEWTADWYSPSYYEKSPYSNPTGPVNGADPVLRGGSCADSVDTLQTTYRFWRSPDLKDDFIGFRCAETAKE
jgi:formylglycine-generating enzyme required for sulfatase activity